MSEFQETTIQSSTATPRWVGLAIGALGAVSLLGIGIGVSALNQAKSVEQSTQASMKQQNDALAQRNTGLAERLRGPTLGSLLAPSSQNQNAKDAK